MKLSWKIVLTVLLIVTLTVSVSSYIMIASTFQAELDRQALLNRPVVTPRRLTPGNSSIVCSIDSILYFHCSRIALHHNSIIYQFSKKGKGRTGLFQKNPHALSEFPSWFHIPIYPPSIPRPPGGRATTWPLTPSPSAPPQI